MREKIRIIGRRDKRIRNVGKKARRITSKQFMKGLGAERVGPCDDLLAPATMFCKRHLDEAAEKAFVDNLQAEIGNWSDKTFPNSTPDTILRHLKKELKELLEAKKDGLPHEIADCVMLLMHLAHKHKISMVTAIREKFEICKRRKWGKPDRFGVIQHIKDGTE